MKTLTDQEKIELAEQVLAKREAQKEYDRKYNGRIKWQNEQYKKFALENGFEMPEIPEEFR